MPSHSPELGLLLIGVGLTLTMLAFALLALNALRGAGRGSERGRVRGGGVILIGPFPIVFGSDAQTVKALLILALALVALMVILIFAPRLLT